MRKTRQGKSIFEDKVMRNCTQERTVVPLLKDDHLRHQLKRVVRNTQLAGTYESVSKTGGNMAATGGSFMQRDPFNATQSFLN